MGFEASGVVPAAVQAKDMAHFWVRDRVWIWVIFEIESSSESCKLNV